MRNPLLSAASALLLAAALVSVPAAAIAHGVQGRADTPIPLEMFIVIAAVVMVVSFIGLGFGWSKPKLTSYPWKAAPVGLSAIALSGVTVWILRIVGLLFFGLLIATALFGSTDLGANLSPLVVFVVWWVGLVPVTALFGNIWRELNPWTALARLFRFPAQHPTRSVPAWLGMWPAAVILFVFAWLELVFPTPAEPRLIGTLLIAYSVLTLAGMRRYGVDAWLDSGEAFSVYTGLLAKLAPVEVREIDGRKQLGFRPPFIAAAGLRPVPGTVAVISVLIATVTYDGLSTSPFWKRRDVAASERLIDLGLNDFQAGVLIGSFGLVASLIAFVVLYELASFITGRIAGWTATNAGRIAAAFAHSLIPIALAYFVAHYFTLFVFQSQDLIRLASDPFGWGWNLFGTADSRIDFQLVSSETIWIVQVIAIVLGHVIALAFAHDRALQLARSHREALLSQAPMLVVMIVLTVAGLWSLSVGMSG